MDPVNVSGSKQQSVFILACTYVSGIIYLFLRTPLVLIALAVLLLMSVISSPWVYFLLFDLYFDPTQAFDLFYLIAYNLVFFFIFPLVFNKVIYQQSIKQIGVKFPDHSLRSLFLVVMSIAIIVPAVIYLNTNQQFHEFYTLALANHNFLKIIFLQFIILPLYYFSEEFFFRGFLLFNLSKKLGWHSIWITDVFFICAHAGKPLVEIIFSIPAGILLAGLTIATRSILPAMVVHYAIGLTIVILITLF